MIVSFEAFQQLVADPRTRIGTRAYKNASVGRVFDSRIYEPFESHNSLTLGFFPNRGIIITCGCAIRFRYPVVPYNVCSKVDDVLVVKTEKYPVRHCTLAPV